MNEILKVKLLQSDAILPRYATEGAACFDLHAIEADNFTPHPNVQHAAIFRTGLAFEVPRGYALLIYSRSGHGFKDAMRLSNCVGVIDSDYRGEVMVSLRFDASADRIWSKVKTGDRIAQAMLVSIPQVELVEVEELGFTLRDIGGFGSTGN